MSLSFAAFGPMAYPLLGCSFLGLIIIGERLIYFITWSSGGNASQVLSLVHSINQGISELSVLNDKGRLASSIRLLLWHADKSRDLREEIVNHWLSEEHNQLCRYFGWLTLIAVISPMLGLLGTVIGIIEAFGAIADHTGPIYPALLADGLGQAMLTTAAGLAIAIPVLVTLHCLRIWTDSRLNLFVETLNRVNLLLEGVDLQELGNSSAKQNVAQVTSI